MITLQHTLCDLLKFKGNMEDFDKEIAYCLLPDSIRAYIGPRPLSHFEENPDGNDISWYKFPADIKAMTKTSALSREQYLADISKKSCLGEKTHIDKFIEKNNDLPNEEYNGILTHLIQDYIFDDWIRDIIDCSNKYEPDAKFIFENEEYDSQGIRGVIAEIEMYGYYLLSYLCNKEYGIVTNQEWHDKNLYPNLERDYPSDLSESTYKYMTISEDINEKITNKDWSGLTNSRFSKYNSKYIELYKNVVNYTRDFDLFFKEYYKREDTLDEKHDISK